MPHLENDVSFKQTINFNDRWWRRAFVLQINYTAQANNWTAVT